MGGGEASVGILNIKTGTRGLCSFSSSYRPKTRRGSTTLREPVDVGAIHGYFVLWKALVTEQVASIFA